jgi:GNAT acetyltransferase-like protein
LIGAETDADRRLALEELRRPLREREADVVVLPQLDVDGPLWELAAGTGAVLTRYARGPREAHRSVGIPDSMDDFMAARSKNTRKLTKYRDKRLPRDHPDARVRLFQDESELGELCEAMERVASTTYQRRLGAGFSGSALELALMRLGMRRRWFRAWVLYFGDRPVAFWQGYAYRGVYAIGCPGFDPEYARDRVGIYLVVKMIEELCESDDIHTLDWGRGDADYKRSFGDHCAEEGEILFYAPTARGIGLRLLRGATVAAVRLAKRVLAASGRVKDVKRAWRARLASDAAS